MSQIKIHKSIMNYLHNELKITKEDIRRIIEKRIDIIVERKMDVWFKQNVGTGQDAIDRMVDHAVRNKSMYYWTDSETKLDEEIQRKIVNALVQKVNLKVEVVPRKDRTEPIPTLQMGRTMRRKVK